VFSNPRLASFEGAAHLSGGGVEVHRPYLSGRTVTNLASWCMNSDMSLDSGTSTHDPTGTNMLIYFEKTSSQVQELSKPLGK